MSISVPFANINAVLGKMNDANVPLADRPFIFTIAVSRLIAYQLPLCEKVEDPFAAFNDLHYAEVEKIAGDINEAVVLNISDVVELTRRIWVFRYRLVHDPLHGSISELMDALIKCGCNEIGKRSSEDFIRYSDHVAASDGMFRPLVLSMSRRT